MLITRWSAPHAPTKEQIQILFNIEGHETFNEEYPPNTKVSDHRHPFTEIRFIISGQLLFNISGTQVLLREGDKIEIPANTRHSFQNNGTKNCLSICAYRPF